MKRIQLANVENPVYRALSPVVAVVVTAVVTFVAEKEFVPFKLFPKFVDILCVFLYQRKKNVINEIEVLLNNQNRNKYFRIIK